jgi:hypothetical protein
MQPPPPDGLLLPEGTLLVHIGPPKTGTSSVQFAFDAARTAIKAQGVHYAGRGPQPSEAVLAAAGLASDRATTPPPIGLWRSLLRDINGAREPRVVVSSEFFADAEPAAVRRIVDDLGLERIHVVVTLRPLARIIASQWQQFVQSGLRTPLGPWLEAAFGDDPGHVVSPVFWRRHRHDRLIARWADVVGPDRMTVIVLDDQDRDMVLRTFERMLGLRAGTLEAVDERSNRSLTLAEVEVVRAFNVAFHEAGLSKRLHTRIMRRSASRHLKMTRVPPPDEPRVELPQWALDRAGGIAADMVPAIARSGVRIVGDPSRLLEVPRSRLEGDAIPEVLVRPEIGGITALGVLVATGLARDDQEWRRSGGLLHPQPAFEPVELERVSTGRLAASLFRRLAFSARSGLVRPITRTRARLRRRSAAEAD